MKHESHPPAEAENQEIQSKETVIKAKHPSWLRRKIIAGGLAAASLAGVGAAEQLQGQERHRTSDQKQNADLSERYREKFHMGAEPEALLIAVDENIQESKWNEVTETLPGVIAELRKHQQLVLVLLKNEMLAEAAPEAVERKFPHGATNALLGASESEISEIILRDIVHQIETDNIKVIESWLPRLIGELQKRLDLARELQTSEVHEQN